MSTEAHGARELTRRLVQREAWQRDVPVDDAFAVLTAGERACRELSRSLGAPGFNALLTRALHNAQAEFPFLAGVRVDPASPHVLGGVPELVQSHGAAPVAAALTASLVSMFTMLGLLIGDDMVARLVERDSPASPHDDEDGK
ncbi:hypothetical protein BH09GEM1_BH09GEM1_12940 [soil metagenome]